MQEELLWFIERDEKITFILYCLSFELKMLRAIEYKSRIGLMVCGSFIREWYIIMMLICFLYKGHCFNLCVCLECMMIEIMLGGKDIQRFL